MTFKSAQHREAHEANVEKLHPCAVLGLSDLCPGIWCPGRMTKAAFEMTRPHNSYSVPMEVDKPTTGLVAGWLLAPCDIAGSTRAPASRSHNSGSSSGHWKDLSPEKHLPD